MVVNETVKLGLDLHGVITEDPEFFSALSSALLDHGHQVFVVTGREESEELHDELKACLMETDQIEIYSSILSITTYQKKQGTPVHYLNGDPSQPMMDPKIWNATKAMLCATAGIHLMIDDSSLYEPSFQDIKTQYLVYTPEVKELLRFMFNYGRI